MSGDDLTFRRDTRGLERNLGTLTHTCVGSEYNYDCEHTFYEGADREALAQALIFTAGGVEQAISILRQTVTD